MVREINAGYAELLGGSGEEDKGQGDEEGDVEEGEAAAPPFSEKWGWIAALDDVADTCRCSWDDALRKSVMEFLNILAYRRDRDAWRKAETEQYLKKN
jgi:hypothetical protein